MQNALRVAGHVQTMLGEPSSDATVLKEEVWICKEEDGVQAL